MITNSVIMIYDEYVEYTSKYKAQYGERTVVLMEVGSFWELYSCDQGLGASMCEICSLLNITLSRKNKNVPDVSATNPMMAGFPSHALGKFVPLLMNDDWTVVLVGQVTAPPNPKRDVVGILSKGTYVEDASCGSANNNYILCIVIDSSIHPVFKVMCHGVGMAYIDVGTGETALSEVNGIDAALVSDEVYRVYSRVKPTEVIIYKVSDEVDLAVIEKVISCTPPQKVKDYSRTGLPRDEVIGKLSYQEFLLKKAFGGKINQGFMTVHEALNIERSVQGACALTALLRYVMEHDSRLVRCLNPPKDFNMDATKAMNLYYNCAEQLELGQLISYINKCVTPMGKRYFRWRLHNPFVDCTCIRAALNETERYMSLYDDVRKLMRDVGDIERLFRRLTTSRIHPHELTVLVNSLEAVEKVKEVVGGPKIRAGDIAVHLMSELDKEQCAKFCIDKLDASMFKFGSDTLFDELVDKKNKATRKYEHVIEEWNTLIACPGAFKLDYNDRDGLHILVTAKRHASASSKLKSCELFESLHKSGITNTHLKLNNEELKDITKELGKLDDDISLKVKERYEKVLSCTTEKFIGSFAEVVDFISTVDFYACTAFIAKQYRYVKPDVISEECSAFVTAAAMRHPLVELLDTHHCTYVPNDIDLRNKRAWLLYGLNAAGKSTLMKMVALNVIMAQSGLFVPCDRLEIKPFTSIFTRITKGDDILTGRSTFMVEIGELRNILKRVDHNSLVIGDELCAGTETLSAIAIVQTGIQDLLARQAAFIFATHLHELVDRVGGDEGIHICHLHVDYDGETLIYDRTLRDGDGPKTYGIEVCKFLGMNDDFVKRALVVRQLLETGRTETTPKESKYNSKLLFDEVCEVCGAKCARSSEVHHIEQQALFSNLESKKMNAVSNLVVLCEECHDKVHDGKLEIKGKRMTSRGVQLMTKATTSKNAKTNGNDTCGDVSTLAYKLYVVDGLSYAKVIDQIYAETGVRISIYRMRKLIQTYQNQEAYKVDNVSTT